VEADLSQTNFLDKTLLAAARIAEQSLFSDIYSRRTGLLQRLDVRVKLVSFLCIIILISFLRAAQTVWIAYGFSLALAVFSQIPIGFFIKRVWLFVPIFSAAVVLPAILNIVTPGDPLWTLITLPRSYTWWHYTIPAEIAVTRQGLWGGILFVSRVATSVSFAVLLTLTTKWAEVFSGLRSLFVPRIFVVTLSMTERYIFVLLRLIQDMYRGRKSRTIKPLSPAVDRNWIASRIGVSFKKSVEMSEDVYKAMLSRGFHGEFRSVDRFRVTIYDYLWVFTIMVAGTVLVRLERGWIW
jgi:cobalt/nickel transport system permease protein